METDFKNENILDYDYHWCHFYGNYTRTEKFNLSERIMKKKNRIVVTGAAGFIGSHTVDRLLENGCEVVGVDNLSTGRVDNLEAAFQSDRFDFVLGDVTDETFVDSLFASFKPDAVVHLAGLVSVVRAEKDPVLNFQLNYQATQIVADAACRNGVGRIVFSSSAAVYGFNSSEEISMETECLPMNLYGRAKYLSERLLFELSESGAIEVACLRYFNVYGPRQDPSSPYAGVISIFADRMARGEQVTIFGDGEQTRDFVSVSDVARANASAATAELKNSTLCNVCTGNAQSLNFLWKTFASFFPSSPYPMYANARNEEIRHSCGDPSAARDQLGFVARKSLRQGLAELLENAGLLPEEEELHEARVA